MKTLVSNQWVAENRQTLFAFGASFIAETPMAGRAEEQVRLETFLRDPEVCTAVISEPLGVGKTFFVMHSIGHLVRNGVLEDEADFARITEKDIVDGGVPTRIRAKVLVIEELDRKAPRSSIEAGVDAAAAWASVGNRHLILTGDAALLRTGLLSKERFGTPARIALDSLRQPLLSEAIRLRLTHWLSAETGHPSEADGLAADALRILFDEDVIRALLPETDPPIATFRDVLQLTQQMAEYLPLDEAPARFTPNAYRDYVRARGRPTQLLGEQTRFRTALNAAILMAARDGRAFEALSVDQCRALDGSQQEAAEYESTILVPLVKARVLTSVGIPYSDEAGARSIVGPYLPTVAQVASALLLGQ